MSDIAKSSANKERHKSSRRLVEDVTQATNPSRVRGRAYTANIVDSVIRINRSATGPLAVIRELYAAALNRLRQRLLAPSRTRLFLRKLRRSSVTAQWRCSGCNERSRGHPSGLLVSTKPLGPTKPDETSRAPIGHRGFFRSRFRAKLSKAAAGERRRSPRMAAARTVQPNVLSWCNGTAITLAGLGKTGGAPTASERRSNG